jgi:hypothetical protein
LAGAGLTRNYFGTGIPMDSYNTQSVTINRGANAILFGLGSPAGIIETSTIMPVFRNQGNVEVRFGSYGSDRQSLDIERVLLEKKLSIRVAGLNDRSKFEQKPAFRDQKRGYAAMEFRPLENTTLRANIETGRIRQRLPHIDPPVDAISSWWQFGNRTRPNNIANQPPNRNVIDTPLGLTGPAGNWFAQPGIIFYQPSDAAPSDAFPAFADGRVGSQQIQYRYLGTRDSASVQSAVPPLSPVAGFTVAKQIIDRSIFDYRKQMLEGPNSLLEYNFKAYNVALEQLFFDGKLGFEIVHDRQESENDRYDTTNAAQGYSIVVDFNEQTNDGRPNPNLGRPFYAGQGSAVSNENEGYTTRATGFFKWDFEEDSDGLLGKILGQQTLTGFFNDGATKAFNYSGAYAAIAPTFRNSNTTAANTTALDSRTIASVVYLGPSLLGAPGPTGAGISGVTTPLNLGDTVTLWTIEQGTNTWVQQTHNVYRFPDAPQFLVENITASRQESQSYGFVWQGNWWDQLLVTTIGWRSDSIDAFNGNNNTTFDSITGARPFFRPNVSPSFSDDSELFSAGAALNIPKQWTSMLPGKPQFTLYANDSENFDASGLRQSVLGNRFDSPRGTSEEFGIGLSAFDGRLTLRATKYKTVQENISDPRLPLNTIAALEERIIENNTATVIANSGYIGFDSPNASPVFRRYLEMYNFKIDSTNANGTRQASFTPPTGVAEIVAETVSEGYEFELVYNPLSNWRILINAAMQEAVRGDIGPDFTQVFDDRLPEWQKIPTLAGGTVANQTVLVFSNQNIINPYRLAFLSTGQPTPELRKWRANMVTNYDFSKNSFMKGWSIGGAARWQDKQAIGYPVFNDPRLGLAEDPRSPFFGPAETTYDAWLGYERKLHGGRIIWKLQLNVRNLLNDNLLIPVRANPVAVGDYTNFEIGAYRIGERRSWEVTSKFSF